VASAMESVNGPRDQAAVCRESFAPWVARWRAADWTSVRRPYIGLANVVLRQHRDPRRALEFLEQVGTSKRTLGPELRDEYWALKAWALAESGQTSEVAPAIENAFRYTPQSKPGVAFTCYNAGMAMLAMGEEAKAREYFQRARESDPEGRWGKLAKEALGERSVFRVS